MKPDPLTGIFTLDDGFALGATTTRTEFLSSQIGQKSKMLVKNEPWCSFRFTVSSPPLAIVAFFKGESLESIQLAIMDDAVKPEKNLEREMATKKTNNSWLISVGLNPGSFYTWGSVWSDYDPKGGSSSMLIRYANCGYPSIKRDVLTRARLMPNIRPRPMPLLRNVLVALGMTVVFVLGSGAYAWGYYSEGVNHYVALTLALPFVIAGKVTSGALVTALAFAIYFAITSTLIWLGSKMLQARSHRKLKGHSRE